MVENQLIAENPKDYQYYYNLGRELASEQQWQKAIAYYQKAIELKDDVALVYHHWGDALINLKRWQKAVKVYQKAIALDDNFAWSYHNLGVALFNLEELESAVTVYCRAVTLNNQNSQFQYSLGKALASKGQLQQAVAAYSSAIDLGLHAPEIYQELGDIFSELQQWNNAIDAYTLAIKQNKNATWSYHNLGIALLQLELPQEAVIFFEKAITIDGNFVSAYYHLGEAFRKEQKWDKAVTAYRKAAAIQPDFPQLQSTLADTLQQRAEADLDAALNTYCQLLKTTDDAELINHKIAVILANRQQLDRALVYSNAAIQLNPENPDYTAFYNRVSGQRSKLYEPLPEKTVVDHSYSLWCKYNVPTASDLRSFCWQIADLEYRPTVSIILTLSESATSWIEETIATIQQQVYPHWQLCLATATVESEEEPYWQKENKLTSIVEDWNKRDRRIQHLPCDKTIEMAQLANTALAAATGEWIALLEPETLLTPNALLEFVWQLETDNTVDIIYGDEDRIKKGDRLGEPWFKPQWCPDLLLSRNYFGSFVLCRASLIRSIGFATGYGNAFNYDLILRLTEKTNRIGHISRILSHSKPLSYRAEDSNKVVTDTLKRRGEVGLVTSNLEFPEIKTIRYQITEPDLVSIIIPTRNLGQILNECLTSIFELTTYDNYEVIVVDNGSNEPETLGIIEQWQNKEPERFKSLQLNIPFNYSLINNHGVSQSQGKYLLFLNNDTKIITSDWLERMVEQAQRPSIGAVGALLLYPDDTVQHAGVILGVTGVAGHGHRNYPLTNTGYNHSLITTTNYSAVTSACLMCRREVFTEVGGFNKQLAVAYNDIDFCLKLQQQGYYNVWLPHVQLYHHESQTRTSENTPEKQQRILQEVAYMKDIWSEIIDRDPCYNRNLTREKEDYSLSINYQAEITAIFLAEASQEQLWGFFIDEPKPGCLKTNSLDIIGWVVGRIANAVSLEIICHNEMITITPINCQRPDVAIAYPQIPEAIDSGFSTTVNLTDLPHKAELNLQVVLADNTKIRLGKIQLRY